MSEVYLDGARLDFQDTDGNATMLDLLEGVDGELKAVRRFVAVVIVEGRRVDDWRSDAAIRGPISGHKEVSIESGSVDAVVFEGLDMAQEYIKVIKENINDCVTELRLGGTRADASFASIFDGLVETVRTLDAIQKGAVKYNLGIFKESPTAYYRPLLGFIEGLKAAKEERDNVLLADLLEYEVAPFLVELENGIFQSSRS